MPRFLQLAALALAVLLGLVLLLALREGTATLTSRPEPVRPEAPATRPSTPPAPAPPTPRPAPKPAPAPSASTTPASGAPAHAYAGLPRGAATLVILRNRAFTTGYDESRRNPAWSAYRLPAEALPARFPRPSRFRADPRTRSLVRHEDYTGSGFDRGHLAPNHAIATRFGAEAQAETFLMTNVIPQSPELNQGPWRLLEATLVDRTAPAAREIWVVVGPVYGTRTDRLASGSAIPEACFMVIADETPRGPRFQAVLAPQSAARRADFRAYLTSVDAVERATQLDLFHELPDAAENRLEAETPACWIEGD